MYFKQKLIEFKNDGKKVTLVMKAANDQTDVKITEVDTACNQVTAEVEFGGVKYITHTPIGNIAFAMEKVS